MGLDAYDAFVQIVEQGTVSAAARVLGVPRPTVSRRLARLEERVGARLVERGARKVTVTRTGRELYQRVRGAIGEVDAAERELRARADTPTGLLRVAIAPLLATPLTPMLLAFGDAHRDVELEVFTETRFADLTAEGFDVAIRGGVLRNPDLVQRRLLTMHVGLYAAPAYLSARGRPHDADALGAHALLRGYDTDDRPRRRWPLRGGGSVAVSGPFSTNDRLLLRRAAIDGRGIALLSDLHAEPALRAGLLEPVLAQQVGVEVGLHVVYAERALLPSRTRAFVDATVAFLTGGTIEGPPV